MGGPALPELQGNGVTGYEGDAWAGVRVLFHKMTHLVALGELLPSPIC